MVSKQARSSMWSGTGCCNRIPCTASLEFNHEIQRPHQDRDHRQSKHSSQSRRELAQGPHVGTSVGIALLDRTEPTVGDWLGRPDPLIPRSTSVVFPVDHRHCPPPFPTRDPGRRVSDGAASLDALASPSRIHPQTIPKKPSCKAPSIVPAH